MASAEGVANAAKIDSGGVAEPTGPMAPPTQSVETVQPQASIQPSASIQPTIQSVIAPPPPVLAPLSSQGLLRKPPKLENLVKEKQHPIDMARTPHTIDENCKKAFQPSAECINLLSELNRKLMAEDFNWRQTHVPPLTSFCVLTLSRNVALLKKYMDEGKVMPCDDYDYILELFPTNIELEIAIPFLKNPHYWKRRYHDQFGKVILFRKRPDWTWKTLYIERYIQDVLEKAQPQYGDEHELNDLLVLCNPYVKTLRITELQRWLPPLNMDKEDIPEVYPIDHISFVPIFNKLINIDELDMVYAMNNVGDEFHWDMFKVSIQDATRLGKAIHDLKFLKILRIRQTALKDSHIQALMKGLIKNKTIAELDLSHCQIEDQGALCIAKVMLVHPTLETLNLCNNKIGGKGAQGISYAFLQPGSCPLKSLNLRLNPLGHMGCHAIMKGLVRCDKPQKLNMASCLFEEWTSFIFGIMLIVNKGLKWLDVSNNYFTEKGGDNLVAGLMKNTVLEWLDVRDCNLSREQLAKIHYCLRRNRNEDVSEPDAIENEQEISSENLSAIPAAQPAVHDDSHIESKDED